MLFPIRFRPLNLVLSVVFGWLLSGCAAYMNQPKGPHPARLGEETAATNILRALPVPKEKVYAAVYKFRDLTGQYKQTETGSNFSTAVTQGTTNILLKALEESGWFVPIERENVSNLLNERKIIRSSMAQFKGEADNLPPLLFAGVIMEGGVVSYDANMITGGVGLRYFGTGGSSQYRQDRVTVYLRAVATKSGKILKTVYTSKTILSQSVDGSVFRFVNFKRLLEAETGFTVTEPAQLAVTEAIEKAVQAMVIEGIRDSLWTASTASVQLAAKTKTALANYEQERAEMQATDVFGVKDQRGATWLVFQPFGSAWRYQGDYAAPRNKTGYGASLDIYLNPRWALQLNGGTGTWATRYFLNTSFNHLNLNILHRFLPYQHLSPLVYAGGGVLMRTRGQATESTQKYYGQITGGTGIEYQFSRTYGVRATIEYNQPLTDGLDGRTAGNRNDYYLRANIGLTIGFSGRRAFRQLKP
jgi:curli production assembly/transport component CsgG